LEIFGAVVQINLGAITVRPVRRDFLFLSTRQKRTLAEVLACREKNTLLQKKGEKKTAAGGGPRAKKGRLTSAFLSHPWEFISTPTVHLSWRPKDMGAKQTESRLA